MPENDEDTEETNSIPALVVIARENPYQYFTLSEAGKIMGLGRDVMTQISKAGPPMLGKKVNLPTLLEWLKTNSEKVEKISRQ